MSQALPYAGTALCRSYLIDQSEVIYLDGVSLISCLLLYGVPQGSVTGPFKFNIYTSTIHDIASRHGLSIHMYANVTRIHIEFEISPLLAIVANSILEACVADIK